jgi:hypothetical protein
MVEGEEVQQSQKQIIIVINPAMVTRRNGPRKATANTDCKGGNGERGEGERGGTRCKQQLNKMRGGAKGHWMNTL